MSHMNLNPRLKARIIGYAVPIVGLLLWWPIWDGYLRVPLPGEGAPVLDQVIAGLAYGSLIVGPAVAIFVGAVIHGVYLHRVEGP